MKARGVDVHGDVGVGLACPSALELVDDGPAAAGPWVTSIST